jgi:TolA-binding protein
MKRHRFLAYLVVFSFVMTSFSAAQGVSSIDPKAFVSLSLNAISSIHPQDRRGARTMLAHQITLFSGSARIAAANELFARLRKNDPKIQNDILGVLSSMTVPWATSNIDSDTQYVYQQLLMTSDATAKSLLDNTLANAAGLYRDGIANFNSTLLNEVVAAEPKLKAMAGRFPKSRYAERASYYLGHVYSKRFMLNDPMGKPLIVTSDSAFEDYIARAERGDFDNRKDYLAAGYFYRALNGWLDGKIDDAQNWLGKGQQKFTDDDRVYVYQLFVSTDRSTVIDKYLPAKSLFSITANFLKKSPAPTFDQAIGLIMILQKS